MLQLDDWPWHYWAKRYPKAIAFRDQQQSYNWSELVQLIDNLAVLFSRQGVNEQSRVALCGKNSRDLLFNYLAVLQLGAVVVPLNPQLPVGVLSELLPKLMIQFAWDGSANADIQWPAMITIYSDGIKQDFLDEKNVSSDHSLRHFCPDRPATMTLTSGSNGLPKAVVHCLKAHLANANGLLEVIDFERTDSWLLSLPLFHVSGQAIVWRWLLKGAKLVLADTNKLAQALIGCTHVSLVPTQLWRLLKDQSIADLKLKQVLLGGSLIPITLTQQAQRKGIRCWCGYGLTEMASTVCVKQADNLNTVGIPLAGRKIKIVNGEIWLSGSGLAMGYWLDGLLHPISDGQGWFHTGDAGEFNDGKLRVIGRLDNQFFSGGEGIQPEEIERVLLTHPEIKIVFVLPIACDEFGQRPVAVLQATKPLELAQLTDWLTGKIARFQMPIACYTLPEALKMTGIKMSRQAVSEWLSTQQSPFNHQVINHTGSTTKD